MELSLARVVPAFRRVGGAVRYGLIGIRCKRLFEARLSDLHAPPSAMPVTYRFGGLDDLHHLTADRHGYDETAKRLLRRRLREGDRLVLGDVDGKPIFSGWLMLGAIECGTQGPLCVSPRRAYSYKLHTVEAFRGKRVMSGFYRFIEPLLLALGYRSIVCWITKSNAASIAAHRRLGFTCIGQAHELLLGPWAGLWTGRSLRQRLKETVQL